MNNFYFLLRYTYTYIKLIRIAVFIPRLSLYNIKKPCGESYEFFISPNVKEFFFKTQKQHGATNCYQLKKNNNNKKVGKYIIFLRLMWPALVIMKNKFSISA